MFTRIPTDFERKQTRACLKTDGAKETIIRMLVMRYRRDKQRILDDLKLLDQLLAAYQKR
jgi:hypothetical protein